VAEEGGSSESGLESSSAVFLQQLRALDLAYAQAAARRRLDDGRSWAAAESPTDPRFDVTLVAVAVLCGQFSTQSFDGALERIFGRRHVGALKNKNQKQKQKIETDTCRERAFRQDCVDANSGE